MNTLADFKRYLALPNAAIRIVSYEWWNYNTNGWVSKPPHNPNYRGVAKLQTNAVALEDENGKKSWLTFPKASEVAFDKANSLITITSQGHRLVYKWANLALVEA